MISELNEVEAAISGSAEVPKGDYLRWARSRNLAIRARAFRLSANSWHRISPEPTMDEQCQVMADYLLACLSADPAPDDFVHSAFDAGHVLASCLKRWTTIPAASDNIAAVGKWLEQLYRESDPQGRNRIETGALEHILEAPRLRRYFDHWSQDPELRQAYEAALAWGLAHPDDV